ncbi:hypothetical protein [Amycolatopsis thermophila]|uniref:Flagellar basal body-associated protein FliL n=1 Tax=Amycolatopsis thermophila TaxID=206084 RepID=A0ABU0ES14_9PSEU|nr:hypothetical protein [Amycolatopsis thermophila]MDQ0378090.1 hypothetical protein [Amycolatopsis thermophila]
MSWQDELRRLDAELANGTITQHQHRKMRDELLAAASGGGAPAPVSSPLGRVDGGQPQWQSANPAQAGPYPGYGYPAQGAEPGAPQGYQAPGASQGYQALGAPQPHFAPGQPWPPQGGQWHGEPQGQPQSDTQQQGGQWHGEPQGQPQSDTQQQGGQWQGGPQGQPQPDTQQGAQPAASQDQAPTGAEATTQAAQAPQAAHAPQADPQHGVQQAAPRDGSQQATGPTTQPQAEGPEQPASPFDTEGPTQSVSAALLATSRPTSAPSPADERATDSMRFPSIEDAPTVITNPVPPPSRRLPAMAPPPMNTGPVPQMPFDPAPRLQTPPKRKPTWLFVTLGVVLVVALVAAGVWFLRDPGGTKTAATRPTTSATSPEAVEARLPTLPGTPNPHNSIMTVDQGVDLKLYSREEGQLMKTNGATQVVFRGSSQGPQGYLVLVIPAGTPEHAATITKGLYDHALTAGLQTVPGGSTDAKTVTGSNATGQMSGTWYTSGQYAVAIWVSQSLDGDPNALTERLAQTKTSLGTALPPS